MFRWLARLWRSLGGPTAADCGCGYRAMYVAEAEQRRRIAAERQKLAARVRELFAEFERRDAEDIAFGAALPNRRPICPACDGWGRLGDDIECAMCDRTGIAPDKPEPLPAVRIGQGDYQRDYLFPPNGGDM